MSLYWAWFGAFNLLLMFLSDHKNMFVDDRKNWFMLGLSISLLQVNPRPLWWVALLLISVYIWRWYISKKGVFGDGDVNALAWMFLGFAIIGLSWLFFFVVVFAVLTAVYLFVKESLFKISPERPTPFFSVLFLSFVFVCIVAGLF